MKKTTTTTEESIGYESFIDTWYEQTDKINISLGQLAYAPVSYRKGLYLRPCDHTSGSGRFDKLSITTPSILSDDNKLFKRREAFVMPQLETNEEYIGYRHKRRHVILLGTYNSENINPNNTIDTFYLCLPLYTVRDERGNLKHNISPKQIARIKLLEIRNLLVTAACPKYHIKECYLDFERLQIIEKRELTIKPVKVSEELKSLIVNRMMYYSCNLMLNEEEDQYVYFWRELIDAQL